jgi:hypothetical protein
LAFREALLVWLNKNGSVMRTAAMMKRTKIFTDQHYGKLREIGSVAGSTPAIEAGFTVDLWTLEEIMVLLNG